MKLGAFSLSLNVKDIHKSKEFYENLGFAKLGGDIDQKWLILKNGNAIVGLFEGMFEKNVITFNPGWDEHGHNLDSFDDVRTIQNQLKKSGMTLNSEVDENGSGPGYISLSDPDGNTILIDQHR